MMSKKLDLDDCIALLKHYEVDIAEGRLRDGTAIAISGESIADSQPIIRAKIGAHSAQRACPVTEFLAETMIDELANSHLKGKPQLSRAVAHLVMKLSRMQVESFLVSFALTATIEGDHYEVLPKTVAVVGTHNTAIPHRLSRHAHDDRGNLHEPKHFRS